MNAARTIDPAAESARIAALPIAPPAPPDPTGRYFQRSICGRADCEWCGRRLLPTQIAALATIEATGGLFGPIGVGHGKTAIVCLAGTAYRADFVIALTKRKLIPALVATYEALRRHCKLALMLPMTYGELSHANSTGKLDALAKRYGGGRLLVVADEVHCLADSKSTRTKRFLRLFESAPNAGFVGVSGTIADHAIKQFAHLAECALGKRSPVPRPSAAPEAVSAWSACLDSEGKPTARDWVALGPLFDAFGEKVEHNGRAIGGQYVLHGKERTAWARRAFFARLSSAPGVVCTTDSSVGTSLVVRTLAHPTPPAELAELLTVLERDGVDPRGDAMPSSDDLWRVARHLSAGFFMAWVWPGGVKDQEWIDARRTWHKAIRAELEEQARPGYDSPFLVTTETIRRAARGERCGMIAAWSGWARVKERPAPPSVIRWVDTYLVEHAAARAQASRAPVIVWYESQAVEAALRALGLDVYGRGRSIPEDPPGRTIAASWRVHAEGANLQRAWATNLVVEPPANGKIWEQLIGRTHRQGQRADEVEVDVYAHTPAFRHALKQGQRRADFAEDSLGNRQKLNIATYIDEEGEDDD
jgi:hypothetical protein